MEQGEQQNGSNDFILGGRQSPTIDVESVDGDMQFQMHVTNSVRSLQRDLENLPNLPERPTIIVNHIYNIHHPSDRPSEQHMQDVMAYGEEYAKHINRRCLDICKMPTKLGPELPHEPTFVATPPLKIVGYFSGKTGIPRCSKYIPDPKYRKILCRECPGDQIDLKSLHQHISRAGQGEECLHTALVGNMGCGKTILSKRYANMVLNREISELSNVDAVHYISVDEIPNCANRELPIRELLFERFFGSHIEQNACKYGYEYFCQNPERMLFIFDGADDLCCGFEDRVERISYTSTTTLRNLLQNIITDNIFCGCRTLITVRDWALRDLTGSCRPQKFVLVGPLTTAQRITLTRSVGLEERMANEFCNNLSRRFHASFHLTKDPLFLYFAISSLQQAAQCQDIVEITSDVMLVLIMMQCLTRSQNSRCEFGDCIETFKIIAFNMIKNGFVGVTCRELQKYCKAMDHVHGNMKDIMIVAPQHKHPVCYRLQNNDYSYFFPSQVFQEVLAALHVSEMSLDNFNKFMDNRLHTERWLVVRRFVCGMLLHKDIKHNAQLYMHVNDNIVEKENKLIECLEEQVKKIETLSSYDKFELLASLHECGEVMKPLIEKHIRNLVLPDITLEPSDLYVLSQMERYIHSLCEIILCFDRSVSAEEYSQFMLAFVKKGKKIRLDLSRLELAPEHVTGLREPVASIINTRHQHKREICLVVKKGTPVFLIRNFEKIQYSFPELCAVKVEEIVVAEKDDTTE